MKFRCRRLVHVSVSGIGSRLKGLASALRVAQYYDMPLTVAWQNNWGCNCPFHKLFTIQPNAPLINIVPENQLISLINPQEQPHPVANGYNKTYTIKQAATTKIVFDEQWLYDYDIIQFINWGCIWLPNEKLIATQPAEMYYQELRIVRQAVQQLMKYIQPIPTITKKIQTFLDKHPTLTQALGVMVRRGDLVDNPNLNTYDKNRCIALSQFHQEIVAYANHIIGNHKHIRLPSYISSENAFDVITQLQKLDEQKYRDWCTLDYMYYPRQMAIDMTTHMKHPLDCTTIEGVQEALVDLLLLSKTKSILSSQSNFSWLAAAINDKPLIQVK